MQQTGALGCGCYAVGLGLAAAKWTTGVLRARQRTGPAPGRPPGATSRCRQPHAVAGCCRSLQGPRCVPRRRLRLVGASAHEGRCPAVGVTVETQCAECGHLDKHESLRSVCESQHPAPCTLRPRWLAQNAQPWQQQTQAPSSSSSLHSAHCRGNSANPVSHPQRIGEPEEIPCSRKRQEWPPWPW